MVKRILFPSLLAIAVLLSCTKESAVDNKEINIGQYKNESIRPGDNFYLYCNGKYWNSPLQSDEDYEGFFYSESESLAKRHYNMTEAPGEITKKYLNNVNDWSENKVKESDINSFLSKLKGMLSVVDSIKDEDTLVDALYNLAKQGAAIPISFDLTILNGEAYVVPKFSSSFLGIISPQCSSVFLKKLGYTQEQSEKIINDSYPLIGKINTNVSTISNLQNKIDWMERIAEAYAKDISTKSSVDDFPIVSKLMEKFGFQQNKIFFDDTVIPALKEFEESTVDNIKATIQLSIAYDCLLINKDALSDYITLIFGNEPIENALRIQKGLQDALTATIQKTKNYVEAYEWTEAYVPKELRTEYLTRCEEMRESFMNRIDKLEWMSNTTKAKAKEKLAAMTFNVAIPDKWYTELFPTFSATSLGENILEGRIKFIDSCKLMCGKNVREDCLNFLYISLVKVDTYNAFHAKPANSMVILPSMVLYPMYDTSKSDAYLYSLSLALIGHEMTHGFDMSGSKYDKNGALLNWWIPSDKMEFEDRCDLLVRCYNNLEYAPGKFTDGKFTLEENTADLGGLLIAFDAYMANLQKAGFTGENLIQQKKKFFESYAELWRARYNDAHIAKATNPSDPDNHSFAKERVNGVVMNIDEWYDLYQVTWGDALYLPHARRAHIW